MRAGEHRSDVESEQASDDSPTDLDDMVFSDEEESREVVVTLAEHRGPTATSAGGEQEAARRAAVPASRKRTASADIIGERAVKRPRSPRPLAASPVPSSSVAGMAEGAGRSEEWTDACAATELVPTMDLQPKEAFPVATAVEQSGRSEGQTGTRSTRDLQSEDALPAAPVGESRAGGRSDPQAGQEPVGTAPTPSEVRGAGHSLGAVLVP